MPDTRDTSEIARFLIEGNMVPGIEGYSILARGVRSGKSRPAFLLTKGTDKMALDIKSCTLFEGDIATFHDAVTPRGSRNLREPDALPSKGGLRGGILFIAQWPYARFFIPEYHTDLLFAKNLCAMKDKLFIQALAVGRGKDLSVPSVVRPLHIPWGLIEREAQDRGNYIVILHVREDIRLSAGSFAGVLFRKGYYLYAGSAMTNLTKRIERHRRIRKRMFWHIDYLRKKAEFCAALPIRTATSIECSVAKALKGTTDWSVPTFGSSDCSCETHLFGMHQDPLHSPAFAKMLLHFRLGRLAEELHLCQKRRIAI